jgi:hypothetical protein
MYLSTIERVAMRIDQTFLALDRGHDLEAVEKDEALRNGDRSVRSSHMHSKHYLCSNWKIILMIWPS